jgi:hypothetical protein
MATFPVPVRPSPTLSKPTQNPSRSGSLLQNSRRRTERWTERRSCSQKREVRPEPTRCVVLCVSLKKNPFLLFPPQALSNRADIPSFDMTPFSRFG